MKSEVVKPNYTPTLTRRQALTRLSLMSSSLALIGCVYPDQPNAVAQTSIQTQWPSDKFAPIDASGYGTDPVLITPQPAPWPMTLSDTQKVQLTQLSELICPGARDTGAIDVLNEWLSAPYPSQQADRELILLGLSWLDADCRRMHNAAFVELDDAIAQSVLANLSQQANHPNGSDDKPGTFFRRLRELVAGAYYSSPQGTEALGYQGNRPMAGDYPGPSKPAMDHLHNLLAELGLEP